MTKHAIPMLILSAAFCGCGADPEERATLEGANDRIQALLKNKEMAEEELRKAKQDFDQQVATLKSTYERKEQEMGESHRQRVAALEEKLADFRMELSMSEKQRLALEEVVEQPQRLEAMRQNAFAGERTVWIVLVFVALSVGAVFAFRYHALRKERRENIVRVISECADFLGVDQ